MSVEDQLDRLINLIEMSVDLENPEKIQEIEKEIVQSFHELKVDLLNQTESKKNLAEILSFFHILLENID